MSSAKRRRILDIVATDATFERTEYRGREVWLGRCLHCNAHLVVGLDGEPISQAGRLSPPLLHHLPSTR